MGLNSLYFLKEFEELMKKLFFLNVIFWISLFVLSCPVEASEVRVDSMGGLDMVLSDETADMNPYTLGNPAGLALLPTQSRFELSAPFYSTTNASGNGNWTYYGISPGVIKGFYDLGDFTSPFVSTAGYQYQGVLVVPGDGWAFQATGGLNGGSEQDYVSRTDTNYQMGQELARAAYHFGPFALGAELQYSETATNNTIPNFAENKTIIQISSQSNCALNTGLLAVFPLGDGQQSSRLTLGGSFSINNLLPSQMSESQINSNGISVTQISRIPETIFEPCLFFEIPGFFQGGILLEQLNTTRMQSLSSSDPSVTPNELFSSVDTSDNFNGILFYKCKLAADNSSDPHPISLNHGILLEFLSQQFISIPPPGLQSVPPRTNSGVQFQIGFGLEREKDFTLGLQASEITNFENIPQIDNLPESNYFYSRFTLGGEKWISSHWALRLSVSYIDDKNSGFDSPINLGSPDFFDLLAGEEITGIIPTAGVGYEDNGLRVDGMVWVEQPQTNGSVTGPEVTYTVFGAQLSLALLFNP